MKGSLQLIKHVAPAVLSSEPMEQNPPSFEGGLSSAVSIRLSNLVVGQRQHTPISPHEGGLDHGHIKLGLGRSHRQSTDLRHMENCSGIGTHKHAGVSRDFPRGLQGLILGPIPNDKIVQFVSKK